MATRPQYAWANGQQWGPPHYKRPKLTPAQRDDIRRRIAEGEKATALALEFGVSTLTIRLYA